MSEASETPYANDPAQSYKLDETTRTSIEGLLEDMVAGGMWGYKQKHTKTERDLAYDSESHTEKLFAYLYADDPDNAKAKWQQYTKRAADPGLIARAERLNLDHPRDGIEELSKDTTRIVTNIGKFLGEAEDSGRANQKAQLQQNVEDLESRKRQHMNRAIGTLFEEEKKVDGMTALRSVITGVKAHREFAEWMRNNKKSKDFYKTLAGMKDRVEMGSASRLAQSIEGGSAQGGIASGIAAAFTKMTADMIRRMNGRNRDDAMNGASPDVRQLLLPAPGKFHGAPQQDGPSLGIA